MMNIETDEGVLVVAQTAGKKNDQRITYSFTNPEHALGVSKKEIILAEILACERLLKYAYEAAEKSLIEKEISELRMAIDLLT